MENKTQDVETLILALRGQKVILDSDLARVYGVPTKQLNQQVRRNKERFPSDFVFQLNPMETAALNRSQIVTGSQKHRDPRFRPFVFTEHGAIMAANVLNSSQAVRMSVFVVRAFVRLREALTLHKDLARRLEDLERKYNTHDHEIKVVFDAIRELMKAPEKPKRKIGFLEEPEAVYDSGKRLVNQHRKGYQSKPTTRTEVGIWKKSKPGATNKTHDLDRLMTTLSPF